jgi:hypothetical protein
MKLLIGAVAAAALLLTAGCNREAETKDGLTAKERSDLDNAAAMLDGNQAIYDTSADSMVPVNDSDPILPPANQAAPAAPTTPAANQGNSAAPR